MVQEVKRLNNSHTFLKEFYIVLHRWEIKRVEWNGIQYIPNLKQFILSIMQRKQKSRNKHLLRSYKVAKLSVTMGLNNIGVFQPVVQVLMILVGICKDGNESSKAMRQKVAQRSMGRAPAYTFHSLERTLPCPLGLLPVFFPASLVSSSGINWWLWELSRHTELWSLNKFIQFQYCW